MRQNKRWRWTAVVLLAWTPWGAAADEIALPEAGIYGTLTREVDAATRRRAIDDANRSRDHGSEAHRGPEIMDFLRNIDVDLLAKGTHDAPEVLVNPEPSSVLVWMATVIGLLAAGYGYRRRQTAADPPLSA